MTPQQKAARARLRTYLGETYGRDVGALILNIADLESNFRADATNSTTSASGLTQITDGHWATLSEHVRRKVAKGEMSPDQFPDGITMDNLRDFDRHKFDEIASAWMTRQNIDFLGERYVARANAQRSALGKPPVANMAELTGGNFAMEAFLIAGGHKDGWGVHTKGNLEGTGFGNAIRGGEVDIDHLMSRYQEANTRNKREGNTVTDGMGHGLSYAIYASDNVAETAGGPKLQLTPAQIKAGLSLKADNVGVSHRLAAPWIDRAQQIDPGFEPTDAEFEQWLPRLDLADPSLVAGANDLVSTTVPPELASEELPRATAPAPVAQPEGRAVSEDPTIAARSSARLGQRIQRGAEQALGAGLEFLIPPAEASTLPPEPGDNSANDAGQAVRGAGRVVGEAAGDLADRAGNTANDIGQGLGEIGSDFGDFIGGIPSAVGSAFSGLGGAIGQGIDSLRNSAADGRREIIDELRTDPGVIQSFGAGLRGQTPAEFANQLEGRADARDTQLRQDRVLAAPPTPAVSVPIESVDPATVDAYQQYQDSQVEAAGLPNLRDAYQQYQDTRVFSDFQRGQEQIVDDFNTIRREESAQLEAEAAARALELQQQAEQDFALSLVPRFNIDSPQQQAFQQPSLADFAVPGNAPGLTSNVGPTNTQVQGAVNLSRITPEDYQQRAAQEVLADDAFGSLNSYINAQRGTDLEQQQDDLAVSAAQFSLDALGSGQIQPGSPEFKALMSRQNDMSQLFSDFLRASSRGP